VCCVGIFFSLLIFWCVGFDVRRVMGVKDRRYLPLCPYILWYYRRRRRIHTLAARGLEEPYASFPGFCNNRQFPVILSFMYFISKNSDSRFTWIHDFEENLTESVGPMPFSAEHLICRYVQTDRRTDELIRVGLGNLRVLQVKRSPPPSRHLRLFWRKKNIKFYFRKKHHTRKNSSVS
jgi:hypothetical protein